MAEDQLSHPGFIEKKGIRPDNEQQDQDLVLHSAQI